VASLRSASSRTSSTDIPGVNTASCGT